MNQADIVALMKGIAPVLAAQIDATTKPLIERLTETSARLAETLERLTQAEATIVELRTKAADVVITVDTPAVKQAVAEAVATITIDPHDERVRAVIREECEAAVQALPEPKPGKSVTVDECRPLIDEAFTAYVAGAPHAAALEEVVTSKVSAAMVDSNTTTLALISTAVGNAIAAMPTPEPGKSVTVGELRPVIAEAIAAQLPGEVDRAVKSLPAPEDGNDGVGIESLLIDRDGRLVVTKTDGAIIKLDRIVGEDGKPGIGFDHIEGEDLGRDHVIRFVRGEEKIEFRIPKLTIADTYQGVWRPGDFKRGDVVTWGGSLFLAKADTADKPEMTEHWQMIVKRGRDGVRKQYDSEAPRPRAKVDFK